MKKYLRIMRLNHWIKQLFIIPGCVASLFLTDTSLSSYIGVKFVIGFISVCLIASANYVINEWLDAEFDRYHPTKKYRSVVTEDVKGSIVYILWGFLTLVGCFLAHYVNVPFLFMCVWLWGMGIIYNVRPFRTKDIPYLDVLSESINNAIRLLMGWFIISGTTIPPSSLVLGYWMAGAFLMAIKRYAEYRMINSKELAANYRNSFRYYTEKSLLISSFFYAMCSVFFIGVFLVKYRTELVLIIPIVIGLYCYYFNLSFHDDSSVQRPEKLYHEKGLIVYCLIVILLFTVLMYIDIPLLAGLTDNKLIYLP